MGFSEVESLVECTHIGVSIFMIIWNFAFTIVLQCLLYEQYDLSRPQQELVDEILGTAVACACSFELILIADYYGIFYFALVLFGFNVLWELTWGQESQSCPCYFIIQFLYGNVPLKKAFTFIMVEGLVSWLIFQYVVFLWHFKFSPHHVGRAADVMLNCSTDIKVTVLRAALIEGLGSTIASLAFKLIEDQAPFWFQVPCKAYVTTIMIVAAYDYTGGYFNPTLAACMKYGCQGETFREHTLVYWLSPVLGELLADYLYENRYVQDVFRTTFETESECGVVGTACLRK